MFKNMLFTFSCYLQKLIERVNLTSNPQGFLTSVLQSYSRRNLVPVDVLGYEFLVLDTEEPNDWLEVNENLMDQGKEFVFTNFFFL